MMARLSSFRQLVSTPALVILAAAACASAKVTSSRGQRVQRNPNLNSAESSLLTFFQESLKRFLANIARKSKKDKKAKKNKKD